MRLFSLAASTGHRPAHRVRRTPALCRAARGRPVYRLRMLGQRCDGIRFYAAASRPTKSRRTWTGLRAVCLQRGRHRTDMVEAVAAGILRARTGRRCCMNTRCGWGGALVHGFRALGEPRTGHPHRLRIPVKSIARSGGKSITCQSEATRDREEILNASLCGAPRHAPDRLQSCDHDRRRTSAPA